MAFMKITMMYGQIEMKVKTINKDMIEIWLKKKLCLMLKQSIKDLLINK